MCRMLNQVLLTLLMFLSMLAPSWAQCGHPGCAGQCSVSGSCCPKNPYGWTQTSWKRWPTERQGRSESPAGNLPQSSPPTPNRELEIRDKQMEQRDEVPATDATAPSTPPTSPGPVSDEPPTAAPPASDELESGPSAGTEGAGTESSSGMETAPSFEPPSSSAPSDEPSAGSSPSSPLDEPSLPETDLSPPTSPSEPDPSLPETSPPSGTLPDPLEGLGAITLPASDLLTTLPSVPAERVSEPKPMPVAKRMTESVAAAGESVPTRKPVRTQVRLASVNEPVAPRHNPLRLRTVRDTQPILQDVTHVEPIEVEEEAEVATRPAPSKRTPIDTPHRRGSQNPLRRS